jgi:hypothetical protein
MRYGFGRFYGTSIHGLLVRPNASPLRHPEAETPRIGRSVGVYSEGAMDLNTATTLAIRRNDSSS